MADRDSVRFGGTVIEYEIRRSGRRRKTIEITVGSDGVRVAAPSATPDDDLRKLVLKRASWILGHKSQRPEPPPKRFVSGETLPYLGRNVRMIFETADVTSPSVRFDHWRFRIAEPPDLNGERRIELIGDTLMTWYKARAAGRLPDIVDRWWPVFGEGPKPRILIRNQRMRWGSCASDGTFRFNWRVMMLEPALVEYVVVHELAHLKVRNHSSRYWHLVREALPDMQQRRDRLREVGPNLPMQSTETHTRPRSRRALNHQRRPGRPSHTTPPSNDTGLDALAPALYSKGASG